MRAEMQHGMRSEIFADPAVESAEGMGGREIAFEHEAHRIAFIAKGRLHPDEHIAKLRAKIGDSGSEPKWILTIHGMGYKFIDPS